MAYCRSAKSRTSKYHLGLGVGKVDENTLKNLKKRNKLN
jgi:hypothetical protein